MATKYADRAFLSINGTQVIDLESATLKQNKNAKAVPTMSPDGFNKGFVQGNTDIDVTLTVAVQNQLGRPKIEAIDFENNDVALVFVVGVDQFVANGLFCKDVEDASAGVGTEVKATWNLGALKLTDGTGNSSLFNITF